MLILSGDTPLLTAALLEALVETHRAQAAAATVLSFVPADIRSYGRVVRDAAGDVEAIVEAADASPEQLAIGEANSSIYVFRADLLWPALERLQPANAQGELYLTDAVRDLVAAGHRVAVHVAPDPDETEGVNTRVELAAGGRRAARPHQHRAHARRRHDRRPADDLDRADRRRSSRTPSCTRSRMLRGETTRRRAAPRSARTPSSSTQTIGRVATVGPFCYVRPGTVLGARSKAGTFVEIKNTRLGEGAKVPHLSYFGDAEVGAGTNVGAGSITANFDHRPGVPKKRTVIGKNVRVAVDTMFVAPVTLGDDVWTAAGSVVTDDVPDNALVGFPPRQTIKEGRGGKRDS